MRSGMTRKKRLLGRLGTKVRNMLDTVNGNVNSSTSNVTNQSNNTTNLNSSLSYFNTNNSTSNVNSNISSQLLTVEHPALMGSFNELFVTYLLPHLLVKDKEWTSKYPSVGEERRYSTVNEDV